MNQNNSIECNKDSSVDQDVDMDHTLLSYFHELTDEYYIAFQYVDSGATLSITPTLLHYTTMISTEFNIFLTIYHKFVPSANTPPSAPSSPPLYPLNDTQCNYISDILLYSPSLLQLRYRCMDLLQQQKETINMGGFWYTYLVLLGNMIVKSQVRLQIHEYMKHPTYRYVNVYTSSLGDDQMVLYHMENHGPQDSIVRKSQSDSHTNSHKARGTTTVTSANSCSTSTPTGFDTGTQTNHTHQKAPVMKDSSTSTSSTTISITSSIHSLFKRLEMYLSVIPVDRHQRQHTTTAITRAPQHRQVQHNTTSREGRRTAQGCGRFRSKSCSTVSPLSTAANSVSCRTACRHQDNDDNRRHHHHDIDGWQTPDTQTYSDSTSINHEHDTGVHPTPPHLYTDKSCQTDTIVKHEVGVQTVPNPSLVDEGTQCNRDDDDQYGRVVIRGKCVNQRVGEESVSEFAWESMKNSIMLVESGMDVAWSVVKELFLEFISEKKHYEAHQKSVSVNQCVNDASLDAIAEALVMDALDLTPPCSTAESGDLPALLVSSSSGALSSTVHHHHDETGQSDHQEVVVYQEHNSSSVSTDDKHHESCDVSRRDGETNESDVSDLLPDGSSEVDGDVDTVLDYESDEYQVVHNSNRVVDQRI